jgi:hypothetical protein
VINEYSQEFSSLSLTAIRISSVTDTSRKRFAKFRFHDLKEKRHKDDDFKVDTGAEANVLPLINYKMLYLQASFGTFL